MLDREEQLAALRKRIAQIDKKYARKSSPAPRPQFRSDHRPARYFVENWLSGNEVETPYGKHFETERLYERHRRHGSVDISSLAELPPDCLSTLSDGEIMNAGPESWAFLDTETTGLAGGAGTYAFLVGVGYITPAGFHVRQYFMRDFSEESSLLYALAEHLGKFEVLITYNGKTYDQPLLETRYRMARSRPPFTRMRHLDLLCGARRLWKLRVENCRLTHLENTILGVEREGDVPGEMIPYLYSEYVRMHEAFRIAPIFHHNFMDILTLACLTAIVPLPFQSPGEAAFHHGADFLGIARWLQQTGQIDSAVQCFRRAIDKGLPDDLLFRALWDLALLEKKRKQGAAAVELLTDLAHSRNPFRCSALTELAKFYEREERDFSAALELTQQAIELEDSAALRSRASRLEQRLAKKKVSSRRKAIPAP